MCKANSKNANVKLDPSKIVERICKGILFLDLNDEQKQEQRNYVATTVHSDYDTMKMVDFVSKYIEWIPTDISAKALIVTQAAVRATIETRTKQQLKLIPKPGKVLRVVKETKPAQIAVEEKPADVAPVEPPAIEAPASETPASDTPDTQA